jgi:hypothetical protein
MFTRILIRLRWPAATLAVISLIGFVLNGWFDLAVWTSKILPGRGIQMGVKHRGLYVAWSDYKEDIVVFTSPGVTRSADWASGWEYCSLSPINFYQHSIIVPLWAIVLAPAFVAAMGFHAHRTCPKPGQCTRCRYVLNGVAVCPECGRAAPSN